MMDLSTYLDELEASSDPAEILVGRIVDDLRGRKGFRHELDGTDDDIVIDMLKGWIEDAKDVMSS